MIYNTTKMQKPFDDTIIRSVDSLVDAVFYTDNEYTSSKQYLSSDQYNAEYRSVFLKLPRRTGKTVYLTKLLQHFSNNTSFKVSLIVPKMTMKHDLYRDDPRVYTLSTFKQKYAWGAIGNYPDIILYDELNNHESLYTGRIFTLGLYT